MNDNDNTSRLSIDYVFMYRREEISMPQSKSLGGLGWLQIYWFRKIILITIENVGHKSSEVMGVHVDIRSPITLHQFANSETAHKYILFPWRVINICKLKMRPAQGIRLYYTNPAPQLGATHHATFAFLCRLLIGTSKKKKIKVHLFIHTDTFVRVDDSVFASRISCLSSWLQVALCVVSFIYTHGLNIDEPVWNNNSFFK